jgi:hypothetical protein
VRLLQSSPACNGWPRKAEKKPSNCLTAQDVQQEGHHPSLQRPEYQVPIPGLDAKGISPELLLSRLNFLVLLYLILCVCVCVFIINFTITIFLSLFLSPSLSLLFLCCNPLLCPPQLLFLLLPLPIFSSSYPSPTC